MPEAAAATAIATGKKYLGPWTHAPPILPTYGPTMRHITFRRPTASGCDGAAALDYVATILVLVVVAGSVMIATDRSRPRVVSATVAAVCRIVHIGNEQDCPVVGSVGDEVRAGADHKAPGKFAKVVGGIPMPNPQGECTVPVSSPHEYVPADDHNSPHDTWTDTYTCAAPDGSTQTCTRQVNGYPGGKFTMAGSWTCTQTEPPPPVAPPTTPATAPDGDIELTGCSSDQRVTPPAKIPVGGVIQTPHVATCTGTDGSARQCDRQVSVFMNNGAPDHVRNGPYTCSAPLTPDQKSAVDQGADADYILEDECGAPTALTPQAAAAAEKAIPTTTDTNVNALMASAQQDMRAVATLIKTLTGRDPRLPEDRASFAASLNEFQQALAVQEDPALADELEQLAPWTSPPAPPTPEPGGPRNLDGFCGFWALHLSLIAIPTFVKHGMILTGEWKNWDEEQKSWYDTVAVTWTATGFAAWTAHHKGQERLIAARQRLRAARDGGVATAAEIAVLEAATETIAYQLARFARATLTGVQNYFGIQAAQVGPPPAVIADALHQMEMAVIYPAEDEHGFEVRNPVFPGVGAL